MTRHLQKILVAE
jgi:broad specificity phosphatase PhoE